MFPLPLVLFPGVQQPLHIFEPRYRVLLADCLAGDRRFGVVYAAADPAHPDDDPVPSPGTIGCVALIQVARPLPDGRSNVLIEGTRRFVLRDWVPSGRPYRAATVDEFDDHAVAGAEADELATQVRHRFGQLLAALGTEGGPPPEELPAEPAGLSFAVAAALDLVVETKQALLALRDTAARLQRLATALRSLVAAAERHAAARERARRNGHSGSQARPEASA
jgi:Lon protease-like protein